MSVPWTRRQAFGVVGDMLTETSGEMVNAVLVVERLLLCNYQLGLRALGPLWDHSLTG
jgi:hypothetical protein